MNETDDAVTQSTVAHTVQKPYGPTTSAQGVAISTGGRSPAVRSEPLLTGFSLSAVGPFLVGLVSLAGPLYPIGLLLTAHNLTWSYRYFGPHGTVDAARSLDTETAWHAAGLLPNDAVVLAAVRYLFSQAAREFFLVVVACTALGMLSYTLLRWISAPPHEGGSRSSAWSEGLKRWLRAIDGIGRRAPGEAARRNLPARASYRLWFSITAHLVAISGLAILGYIVLLTLFGLHDLQYGLFFAFLYAVPIVSCVALLLHVRNWLEFNKELPGFSSHVSISVILLAVIGLLISLSRARSTPYFLVLLVAVGDGLIFLSMIGDDIRYPIENSRTTATNLRRGSTIMPLILVLHTFPVVYTGYSLFARGGLGTGHQAFLQVVGIAPYVAGFGAGLAFYLTLRILLLGEPFWKWITPAVLCAYGAALVPVYTHTGPYQDPCHQMLPAVTIYLKGDAKTAVHGDWLTTDGDSLYIVTRGARTAGNVQLPDAFRVSSFPLKDATYVFGGASIMSTPCKAAPAAD